MEIAISTIVYKYSYIYHICITMYNQFLIDHFDSYRITNQKSALTQCHPLEYSEKNVSYYSLFLIDSLNILKLVYLNYQFTIL